MPRRRELSYQQYDVGLRAYSGEYSFRELKRASPRSLRRMKERCLKTLAEWKLQLELAQKHFGFLCRNTSNYSGDISLQNDLATCGRVVEKSELHVHVQEMRLERINEVIAAAKVTMVAE